MNGDVRGLKGETSALGQTRTVFTAPIYDCFAPESGHSPTRFLMSALCQKQTCEKSAAYHVVGLPHCDRILGSPGYCSAQTNKIVG